ncbi:MAG: hypothetical protein V4671_13420, partial [Armatimonadota bacterium]
MARRDDESGPSARYLSALRKQKRTPTAVNAVADEPKLETEDQKTLYVLGLTINRSLSPFNLSPSE